MVLGLHEIEMWLHLRRNHNQTLEEYQDLRSIIRVPLPESDLSIFFSLFKLGALHSHLCSISQVQHV